MPLEEIVYLSVDLPDIRTSTITPKRKCFANAPEISPAKFHEKGPTITKVLESYDISEVSGDDYKREDLKQEQDFKLNAKIALEKLFDSYLEILMT
ncbi:7751_t:CDS:2 [Cetraspora pellucida]|uniref:7751_t:CDS:1 n=1 Tax=Cetraspora pellucida TaxID=1433469 RepID=A0A9N9NA09_9GLOM|nr:7751_t:CDS:2 [Cetraspora pellucida]